MAREPGLPDDTTDSPRRSPAELDEALKYIREALGGLQYGHISVMVQDGLVVQVECTEKKRIRRRAGG